MKKRFLLMSLVLILVCALVGGATFAIFTDSANNSNHQFAAGTVAIIAQRDLGDPVPGPLFYTTLEQGMGSGDQAGDNSPLHPTGLWQPGDSHVAQLDVFNDGSLKVRLNKIGAQITGDAAFLNNPAAMEEFAKYMHVKVNEAGTNNVLYDDSLAKLLVNGGVPTNYKPEICKKSPGALVGPCEHLTFTCTLSTSAGNALQNVEPVVAFYVYAEQTQNNP